MTRLRAKIDMDVNSLATRSIKKVPTIARPPISGGSRAATRLRKNTQREQEEERERQELGAPQVALHLLVHLLRSEIGAAERHPGSALEAIVESLRGVRALLVAGRLQGNREIGGAAIPGDERPRAGVVVVADPAHRGIPGDPRRERLHSMLRLRRGRVDPGEQGDDAEVLEARRLEPTIRLDALGRGIVRSVGLKPARDAGPERAGDDRCDERADDHGPRAPSGEIGHGVEHQALLRSPPASASRARFVRSHQSAIHWWNSIPWVRTR